MAWATTKNTGIRMMGMATRSGLRLVGRSGNPVIKASTTRSSSSWKVRLTPTMFDSPNSHPCSAGLLSKGADQ